MQVISKGKVQVIIPSKMWSLFCIFRNLKFLPKWKQSKVCMVYTYSLKQGIHIDINVFAAYQLNVIKYTCWFKS